MTLDEASELLKSIVPPLDIEIFRKTAKHYEAIDMAIKSLEAWEKVKAEIDRQQKWLLQAGYTMYNVDIAFDAIKAVVAESEE